MAFRVEIAPRALADIEAAFLYIKKESPERAAKWLLGVIDAIYSLEEMPGRCPVAPESRDAGQAIRLCFYGKRHRACKIFFSIHSNEPASGTVRVFHVRHGARRPLHPSELQKLMGDD